MNSFKTQDKELRLSSRGFVRVELYIVIWTQVTEISFHLDILELAMSIKPVHRLDAFI